MALKKSTAKKPAAKKTSSKLKTSTAKKAAPKATKKTNNKVARTPSYKVGDHATFNGYSSDNDDPLFEAGDTLAVVGIAKDSEKNKVIQVVAVEDFEEHMADPNAKDGPDGDEVLPSELTKIKKEKVVKDPYALKITHVAGMEEYLEGDLVNNAKELQDAAARSTFYLGGLITELYKDQRFRKDYKGYEDELNDDETPRKGTGWAKFCEEELGMSTRKASDLQMVYMNFGTLEDFGTDQLDDIGWSKAVIIAPYVTNANAEEVIKIAENTGVRDLREAMKTDYLEDRTSGTNRVSTSMKRITFGPFKLLEDQAESVEEIFKRARKQFGIDDADLLFEAIVTQWAMENLGETASKAARAKRNKRRKELKGKKVDVSASVEHEKRLNKLIEKNDV